MSTRQSSARGPVTNGITVSADVSKFHYDKLAGSHTPFVCWLCTESVHDTIIQQLQRELGTLKNDLATKIENDHSELAKLKHENATLRAAIDLLNSMAQHSGSHTSSTGSCNNNRSVNPGRRMRRSQKVRDKQGRPPCSAPIDQTTTNGGAPLANTEPTNNSAEPRSSYRPAARTRTQVLGSRKIWGTLKSTSTQDVSNTISSLMQMPDTSLIVKRKFKILAETS